MVNLTTANNALKTVYLDVLDNLLNVGTNPLFAKIKKTTDGVCGKEIKVMAPFGVNGGITATSETGVLPMTGNNDYLNFTTSLKNLYGRIEISDKAVRASQNSAGAFVNLLNDEMEGLVKSSALNLSRMIYDDGRGLLSEIKSVESDGLVLTVDNVNTIWEGMIVDIADSYANQLVNGTSGRRIVGINRANKTVTLDAKVTLPYVSDGGHCFVVQGSYCNEITGLKALFMGNVSTLYGLRKADYPFMAGRNYDSTGNLTDVGILEKIDNAEESTGAKINYIACSSAVRRSYQASLIEAGRNIETIDIGNGFKALDFYGIPMVSERFICDNKMYLLDTDCYFAPNV